MSISGSASTVRISLLRPILAGGVLAGTFDLTAAFISFGLGNPRVIAGGLLGRARDSWRSGHVDFRRGAALLHRILSSGDLLYVKPKT